MPLEGIEIGLPDVDDRLPQIDLSGQLMQAILYDRLPIAEIVNATVIPLADAAKGYSDFDSGVARKFVLDPHGLLTGN
jgi:glutathione-independent formaldehyde dehydrogenase